MPVKNVIQTRRDTAANWTSTNPILAAGEKGLETDTKKFKFGDGTSTWTALGYANVPASGGTFTGDVTVSKNKAVLNITGDGTNDSSLNITDNFPAIELKSSGTTGLGYIDFADSAIPDFDVRLQKQARGTDAIVIMGKTNFAVDTTQKSIRNITLSTAAPSGGADGDVWLTYTA